MAFLDNTNTLEEVLGQTADNRINTIDQQYAKQRRKAIAEQAAGGRLRSGVANYTFGDINANQAGDVGDVYSELASALGTIPMDDYANEQDNQRQLELATLIGKLNQSGGGKLGGALGGLQGALSGGMTGFQLGGPWGAAIGAGLGGSAGSYGGLNKRRTA